MVHNFAPVKGKNNKNLSPANGHFKNFLYIYRKRKFMAKVTKEIREEICKLYPELSIIKLGKKFGFNERRVRDILIDAGKEITNSHKKTVSTDTYIEDNLKRFPEIEGKEYLAVLKGDNSVRFKDYLNKSGCMSSYIKKHFKVEVPSLFLRKKYFHENGKQWHEQWFDIILVDKEEKKTKKCPYCNWETDDIDNRSRSYIKHINTEHDITREKHLELHPEDREYLSLVSPTLDRKMETDPSKYVTCAICGEKFARLDWRHLGKHGITKREYQEKYGDIISEDLCKRLSENMVQTNMNMKPTFVSTPQRQIYEFIKSKGLDCELCNRKVLHGKEIDVYVPSLKIGIEYNGNFWHSEGMNGQTTVTHRNKTDLAKKYGVKLIQIFEDEYFLKRDIVYEKISHLLGLQKDYTKIMARKCTISHISTQQAREFLERYHIQGYVDSTLQLGAFYEDNLIAVMSFKRKSKKNENKEWELTRFASNSNFICSGVGGKLFSYFKRNYEPNIVTSFADRRWTINEEDNVYLRIGFKFDHYTKPNYQYYNPKVDHYRRFHKFAFKKSRLNKKFGLPLSMTETEMTEELGYKKIFDCGLIKYVWKKENAID